MEHLHIAKTDISCFRYEDEDIHGWVSLPPVTLAVVVAGIPRRGGSGDSRRLRYNGFPSDPPGGVPRPSNSSDSNLRHGRAEASHTCTSRELGGTISCMGARSDNRTQTGNPRFPSSRFPPSDGL